MRLRLATKDDAIWIDEQYVRAGFLASDLSRDTVVVAEVDGERVALGRLVPAGENSFELGGMYVLDGHRGEGLARAIVDELIRLAGDAELYCVPFADLEELYAAAGFRTIDRQGAPAKIDEKLDWCAREVARPVLLMKR